MQYARREYDERGRAHLCHDCRSQSVRQKCFIEKENSVQLACWQAHTSGMRRSKEWRLGSQDVHGKRIVRQNVGHPRSGKNRTGSGRQNASIRHEGIIVVWFNSIDVVNVSGCVDYRLRSGDWRGFGCRIRRGQTGTGRDLAAGRLHLRSYSLHAANAP